MSEWPSCITAPNGKWIRLDDFERLLDFATNAMIAGKLIKHRSKESIKELILETCSKEKAKE